jgi:hypothetical protein
VFLPVQDPVNGVKAPDDWTVNTVTLLLGEPPALFALASIFPLGWKATEYAIVLEVPVVNGEPVTGVSTAAEADRGDSAAENPAPASPRFTDLARNVRRDNIGCPPARRASTFPPHELFAYKPCWPN